MPQKDVSSKLFFMNLKNVAELCNLSLFSGCQEIKPAYLSCLDPSQYRLFSAKTGNPLFQARYRDLFFMCRIPDGPLKSSFFIGIELQSTIDTAMPLRVNEYDTNHYIGQLKPKSGFKGEGLLPVITIVVNLSPIPWVKPLCLHDLLKNTPKKILDFVSNTRMVIFDPFKIDDELLQNPESELCYLTKGFKYQNNKAQFLHVIMNEMPKNGISREGVAVLCVFLNIMIPDNYVVKGEVFMCKAWEEITNDYVNMGRMEGRQEGLEAGRQEGLEAGRQEGLEAGRQEGLEAGRQEGEDSLLISMLKQATTMQKTIHEVASFSGCSLERLLLLAKNNDISIRL